MSPFKKFGRSQGFTLVELLVVLTLMGTLLSLVAPLSVETLERVRSRDELLDLKHLLRLASADAFLRSRWSELEAAGPRLVVRDAQRVLRETSFTYLVFPPQTIALSPQGLPQGEGLRYRRRGQEEILRFEEVLRPRKAQPEARRD